MRLVATADYSSWALCDGCTPEKKVQIYIEKDGMAANWLLHHNQYMTKYYIEPHIEHYNTDIQIHNPEN